MLPVAPLLSVHTWAAPDAVKEDVGIALVAKLNVLALTCKEAELSLFALLIVPVQLLKTQETQVRCKLVSCRNKLSSHAEVWKSLPTSHRDSSHDATERKACCSCPVAHHPCGTGRG